MNSAVFELTQYIGAHDGIADKSTLSKLVQQ